jgi:hypothetical protein
MYLDSGASRSVIHEESPIRQHLSNVSTTTGSCNVGNGANLKYLEKGMITKFNEVTVVQDLNTICTRLSRQLNAESHASSTSTLKLATTRAISIAKHRKLSPP